MKKKVMFISLSIAVVFVLFFAFFNINKKEHTSTLPGANEIYPTVMVNGELYEWHQGYAIYNKLPENYEFYGKINHIEALAPENDCDFSSTFECNGEIYVSSNNEVIYLKLNTDWLDGAIVQFDIIKSKS